MLAKKYILYLLRWQLSTPILSIVLYILSDFNVTFSTIVANLIGGLIFFWIDKFIFVSDTRFPKWEVKQEIRCADCGKKTRGYRLVKAKGYDRIKDNEPEFRCEECSQKKLKELKDRGVQID